MKKILSAIALIFVIVAQAQKPARLISCNIQNMPLSEYCSIVYSQSSVKVYYHEKWVDTLKVTLNIQNINALQALQEALKGTVLQVSPWNSNLVILPGDTLITRLPSYGKGDRKESFTDSLKGTLTQSEEKYMIVRRGGDIQVLQIGQRGAAAPGSKVKILGRILDEETGEPIYGASVFIAETNSGEVSNDNGYMSLILKIGIYNVQFEYLGYGKKKYKMEIYSDGSFKVNMQKVAIQMSGVIVYGDREMNIRVKDPGLDKMSIKAIRELPMMMGERDILKVSSTLPGIVSVGEGSAGLNVRGGGSDQNAFYINKVPIYNTSHLFGFFPAFNADIIKDFSIYKGYIPAQYGGHLSSVFNIDTRQGNRKYVTAHGGISPITGSLVIEGPLKKDTCSFMLSGRSSYSDWILKKLNDPDIRNSSAAFNDLSAGINYDIRKTQLALFAYHSYDRFRLSDLNSYEYANNGASAIFSHNFSNDLRAEFSLIGSQYSFSTTDQQEESNAYEHAYKMEHYEFRSDFKHLINNRHSLEYGIGMILYKLDRGTVQPYGDKSLRKIVELGEEQGVESAIYISDSYEITPWLTLTAGARYALYTPIGPKTVYGYAPGNPLDVRYITDTIIFSDHQPITWYHQPDLRVSVIIKTDDAGSVKLAFNQMHQNLFMLSNTISIAPNTQWKLADYHLLPSQSNQYSVGVFRTLAESGLETSAEIYYKKTTNFPEFKDGADFLGNPLLETAVLQGDQQAWGVEFFLKRSVRKLSGWISYTYSRSMIKVDGGSDWSQINEGETYPANFDIPHALNVVLNYHVTRRITFASIFTYQTGKPVTYPVSVYYVNGLPTLDYSSRNAYRIPDYVRADFSLTIEGNLKKKKLLHSSLIFNVYNAAGRENPYSVYFKTENGSIRSYQYSVIGVPVFTVTWLFKLGNYASE